MRIVIVGPGSLGILFAARLSLSTSLQSKKEQSDFPTSLFLLDYKNDRAKTLHSSTIRLEENNTISSCHIPVTANPLTIKSADIILLCVKSTSLQPAIKHIQPLLSPDTLLIGMQNGISHPALLQETKAEAAIGITSEGATLLSPGHVLHGGSGITRLGILNSSNKTAKIHIAALAELLREAGFKTELTEDPLKYLWAKLFVNIGINALTSLYNVPNGQLLDSPEITDMMKKAVREAEKVAGEKGIRIDGDPVERTISVCQATANNISSMLQDVRKKRYTEINAINGAITDEGRRLGIATPINDELVKRIKTLESNF